MIRTYRVQTDTTTSAKDQTIRNSIDTTLRQTTYKQSTEPITILSIEQVVFRQSDQSPMAHLLNDLNPINEWLVFEVGPLGELLHLHNLPKLQERWQQLKPFLWNKYARTQDGVRFLNAFEYQLYRGDLLVNIKHKGAYGVLMPALFGPTGQVRQGISTRRMTGFFGDIDLPLTVETTVQNSLQMPGVLDLYVVLKADTAQLDEDRLRAMAQEAMGLPNFQVVHRIEGQEHYKLAPDATLLEATQKLSVVIEGLYHHYTQHTLTLEANG
ncbi:hypothetical protein [Fibrella arboris]|uniref:hypothetical protein n=1 Tax=Fibrella arboris TaxID=3242486 RepID=UPI003521B416